MAWRSRLTDLSLETHVIDCMRILDVFHDQMTTAALTSRNVSFKLFDCFIFFYDLYWTLDSNRVQLANLVHING